VTILIAVGAGIFVAAFTVWLAGRFWRF